MSTNYDRPTQPATILVDDEASQEDFPPSPQPQYDMDPREQFFGNETRSRRANVWERAGASQRRYMQRFKELSLVKKLLYLMAGVCAIVLFYLIILLNGQIFAWLTSAAKRWREVRGGWVLLWFAIFITAFPPLIGYSLSLTTAGMVYGFPNGWFIAASANIAGSACSFPLYRKLFLDYMTRKVAQNKRFAAFSVVLKHDGLGLLCMIRLCPIPYSFSNGAIATFPTVSWFNFTLATAIVSPKLLTHIFIGSRLAALAENGKEMDAKTKFINYFTIFFSVAIGFTTAWIVYRRTKMRAKQLEAQGWGNDAESSADLQRSDYSDDFQEDESMDALR